MANTNIQLYTNINTVINYIAKYISKAKNRIKCYEKITSELIP